MKNMISNKCARSQQVCKLIKSRFALAGGGILQCCRQASRGLVSSQLHLKPIIIAYKFGAPPTAPRLASDFFHPSVRRGTAGSNGLHKTQHHAAAKTSRSHQPAWRGVGLAFFALCLRWRASRDTRARAPFDGQSGCPPPIFSAFAACNGKWCLSSALFTAPKTKGDARAHAPSVSCNVYAGCDKCLGGEEQASRHGTGNKHHVKQVIHELCNRDDDAFNAPCTMPDVGGKNTMHRPSGSACSRQVMSKVHRVPGLGKIKSERPKWIVRTV